MTDDELSDLLELALARRTDHVAHAAFWLMPEDARPAVAALTEDLAALALAEHASTAGPALRARLLATVRARAPRRAVLVIDMICDHLTPGRILEVPRARAIVPALAERVARARRDGTPVVYVLDRHAPDDSDLAAWGEHAVEGSEGAEVWPALAPSPGDRVVPKPSYSSFYGSELEATLDELGVDTLELTGCSTEVQLLSTATDALQRGFVVEVPRSLQAGTSAEAEEAALRTMQLLVPYGPSRDARLAKLAAAR